MGGPEDLAILLHSTDEVALDRELTDRSFAEYMDIAWDIVEPASPFISNWHIGAIAEHLEAAYRREITRLVINVPPGSTKSMSCCVLFPTWVWTQNAKNKFIFGSYSDRVSYRDALRSRRLIQSDWYKERWGEECTLRKDEQSVEKYSNEKGGFRLSTTVRGGVTGEHADIQVVDDPLKPLEVTGSMNVAMNALEAVNQWWTQTMATRLTSFDKGVRIIIMQRLHEGDLAGEALKEGGYEHLMLPMEFEKKRKCYTTIGFEDPRTEEGELLFEARFPKVAVDKAAKDLGSRGAQAQFQQNPLPAAGSILMLDWFKYYMVAPRRFTMMIQSWDCTFKEEGSSFVVGQVWGAIDENYYLLDQVRGRWGFVDTCKEVKKLTAKWPRARYKLVEAKANGSAVVDTLRKQIAGFKLIEPEGGKIARVHAVEPLFESGSVFVPHEDLCPWMKDDAYVDELTGFPSRINDDQVDATSQALVFLQTKRLGRLREAMARIN